MKSTVINTNHLLFVMVIFMIITAFSRNTDSDVAKLVRANEIELVDTNGKVRVSMKVEEGGEVVFRLKDQEGQIRVKLGANREGSGLVLLNGNTNPGIHMLSKTTGATLTLLDKDGQKKVIQP